MTTFRIPGILQLTALLACLGQPVHAWAVHYDVEIQTSAGPVAGSRILTDFYGDLDLEGKLPVDFDTGYKIFPGYFDDLEGGPRLTDDPGFQAFPGTFLSGEEIHFRALGTLEYWDAVNANWVSAPSDAAINLYGGIPNDVALNYLLNPFDPAAAAAYAYWAGGTQFTSSGVAGPASAVIDDAKSNGAFHAHLDWELGSASANGVYLVTLQLWSPVQYDGTAKYLDSDPFMVIFKSAGVQDAALVDALDARLAAPVPEPSAYLMTLAGLALVGGMARWRANVAPRSAADT